MAQIPMHVMASLSSCPSSALGSHLYKNRTHQADVGACCKLDHKLTILMLEILST